MKLFNNSRVLLLLLLGVLLLADHARAEQKTDEETDAESDANTGDDSEDEEGDAEANDAEANGDESSGDGPVGESASEYEAPLHETREKNKTPQPSNQQVPPETPSEVETPREPTADDKIEKIDQVVQTGDVAAATLSEDAEVDEYDGSKDNPKDDDNSDEQVATADEPDDEPLPDEPPPTFKSSRSKLLAIISKPGILAGIVGGAIIGILTAVLLIMFIVYRMRKKDEGSYALEETKKPLNAYDYRNCPTKEFYA